MSVSASVLDEKSYTEPAFAVYAGYSGFIQAAITAYTVSDMVVSFTGLTIESLGKLKPDNPRLIYLVLKPTKLAVMQNQNFDRVSVSM